MPRTRGLIPTLCLGVCLASPATLAATLRGHTMLKDSHVHLSDLFAGLAPEQDCEIGAAPAPGQSLVIGGAQLEAIAAQFGIDWPGASDTAQSVLTRASRSISPTELLPIVESALRDKGLPGSANIELSDFTSPAMAIGNSAPPTLHNIVYDASHGRFSAFFGIPADDGTATTFRVDGTVSSSVDVVVARHELASGQIITRDDLDILSKDSRHIPAHAILDLSDAVGQSARKTISQQTILTPDQLDRIMMVEKGSPVILAVASEGMRLTATGVALDAGSMGQHIHVLNPASHMVVIGEIVDKTRVDVLPGSTPMPADQRTLRSTANSSKNNI